MGDFDKNQPVSDASQKKKMVLVGLLAVVLVGVLAFHFMRQGPGQASAAGQNTGIGVVAVAMPEETAAQARAALEDDPTAKLLRGTQNHDSILATTPRNPFRMSDSWRSLLVKAAPVDTNRDPVVDHTPVIQTGQPSLKTDGLKLSAIFRRDSKLFAVINGEILTVGGVVGSVRVAEIGKDRVILESAEGADFSHAVLTIDSPKLK